MRGHLQPYARSCRLSSRPRAGRLSCERFDHRRVLAKVDQGVPQVPGVSVVAQRARGADDAVQVDAWKDKAGAAVQRAGLDDGVVGASLALVKQPVHVEETGVVLFALVGLEQEADEERRSWRCLSGLSGPVAWCCLS